MDTGVTLYYTEEIWREIYDRARKKGKVIRIDNTARMGYDYEYALLNSRESYGRYRVSTKGEPYTHDAGEIRQAIRQEEDEGSPGKSFAGYAFVFERLLPRPDFADYVGLHEWLEAEHVHKNKADRIGHGIACRGEAGEVLKRSEDFVGQYASWLLGMAAKGEPGSNYFDRAIPGFTEALQEGKLGPAEILREFKRQLDADTELMLER